MTQVSVLIATLAREGNSGYSLTREVEFWDMTDATPTRAQRFAAAVVPAAERAGYTGHGAKARFARDTGMTESSVTRLWQGIALPDARFYAAISDAVYGYPDPNGSNASPVTVRNGSIAGRLGPHPGRSSRPARHPGPSESRAFLRNHRAPQAS